MTRLYAELVALAERELELVREERFGDLDEVAARRDALVAELPAAAPPAARPELERLAGVRAEIERTLRAGMAEAAAGLQDLRRSRGALRGYAAAGR